MSVLSFRRRSSVAEMQPVGDWQDHELSQIFGAYRMLAQNGVPIGLDRGRTDADEPWAVFFDLNTQEVFLHVARIAGQYVLACEALGVTLSDDRLSNLLQAFEAEMRRYLAVEMGKNDNVITHPAARLMITMTAVFLLSRLDNNDVAFAQAQDDQQTDKAERKAAETSIIGRAQKVVTKLYEATDTPTAIAAIAGILVSLELLSNKPQQVATDASDQANAWLAEWSERDEALGSDGDSHIAQDDLAHAIVPPESEIGSIETAQLAVENPNAHLMPASVDLSVGLTGKFLVEGAVGKSETVILQRKDGAAETAPMPLEADETTAEVAAEEPPQTTAAPEAVSRAKPADTDPDPVVVVVREQEPETSVAADLIETVLIDMSASFVFVGLVDEAEVDVALVETDNTVITGPDLPIQDYVETAYSIDKLGEISGMAGFVHSTSFAKAQSVEVLRHFIDLFETYEVEVADQIVLIEQHLSPDVDAGSIGIWTNRMSDGSEVTVLGQIDLISDVATLFEIA